jgi:hypothetical protein
MPWRNAVSLFGFLCLSSWPTSVAQFLADSPLEEDGFRTIGPAVKETAVGERSAANQTLFRKSGTDRRYGAGGEEWQLRRCI